MIFAIRDKQPPLALFYPQPARRVERVSEHHGLDGLPLKDSQHAIRGRIAGVYWAVPICHDSCRQTWSNESYGSLWDKCCDQLIVLASFSFPYSIHAREREQLQSTIKPEFQPVPLKCGPAVVRVQIQEVLSAFSHCCLSRKHLNVVRSSCHQGDRTNLHMAGGTNLHIFCARLTIVWDKFIFKDVVTARHFVDDL